MTLVTRAKVRLLYARYLLTSRNEGEAREWFWFSNEDLIAAHEDNVRGHEHPYVTFFSYAISLLKDALFTEPDDLGTLVRVGP